MAPSTSKVVLTVALIGLCLVQFVACEDTVQNLDGDVQEEFRSFRHALLKRAGFALIPAAFVVGMITTLLSALTVVSIKSLGVGLVLLVLTVGQMMARTLPAISAYAAPPPPPPVLPTLYKWKK